eukprot:XP_011664284.1 PREDICTED: vinexin isoform X6 [Strongylocentrotus purpuratus]
MSSFVATLQGGAPWGLRLQGGSGTGEPLRISKINPGSKASRAQLHVGDIVETVNGVRTGDLPVSQAQKLLHNNSNDLQLRIHRSQSSVNGSYHPNGKMSSQSSLIVTNDSGFSGTGSPTSPPMSPTNGFQMSPSKQKGWVLTDMTTGFLPKSRGAALFERRKKMQEEREQGGVPPPSVMDIPTNNNNQRKDEDEFWPPPPPPDESIWPPSEGGVSVDRVPDQMAPPPPPLRKDEGIAPVWTPGGGPSVKKEFKPVKLDLSNRPKISSVNPPTYSSPAAHTWSPSNQGVTSPHPPITPQSNQPQYTQPMAVDTLPDPSHILSPGYVSPRSPSQQPHPPPPPQFAGEGPASPRPPVSRAVPVSPAGAVPYQPGGQVPVEGMSNGYGFLPASAVLSGSPGAIQSDPSNLPPGALFQKQTIEGDVVHTDTFYPVQGVTRKTSTVVKHEAPNYEGIGPRDKDGLPLGLRQHVKEDNRHDWYKEMFKSIHKQDRDEDDSDDISISQNVEDDSSDSVFMSESDVMHAPAKDDWKKEDPRNNEPETVVKNTPSYRVQPGRIQNFVPGKSALAAHEKSVQAKKDGLLYYEGGRRGSAPGSGSGYASDDEARKGYHTFVKSGELPNTSGFGFGAPKARRETKTSTAGPIQPSLQPPSNQQPPTTTSSLSSPSPSLSPALHGAPPPITGGGFADGVVLRTGLTRSASLSRTTGLPKRRQRYSEGSGLTAAQRLGIKTPPPARLSASSNTKPVVQDSRYDYMNQLPSADVRQISEKKPRQVREPDASYNKSLPEYLPIKSPSISDDRFDDFDFSPPVTVTATKQEVLPKVERTPSLEYKLTRASAIAVYPFTAQSKKELSFKKGDTIYLTREIDKNWVEGEHHGNKGIFPRTYVEIVTSIEEARNLQVNAPSAEGKGRAKYRFKGETANELSVNKGEIVDLVRKIDNNWWEVRHGNKAGIVPVAYLDVLREPQQGLSSPQPKSPASSGGGRGPLSPNQAPRSPSIQAHRSPSTQAPRSPSTQAPRSPSAPADNLYQPSSPYQSDTPTLGRQQPSHQNRAGQGSRSGGGGGQRGMQPTGGRPAQNAGFHQKRPDGERFRAVYSYQPSNDDELEIMEGETVVVMEKCDDGWYVGFSEATGRFGTFPGNYVQRL